MKIFVLLIFSIALSSCASAKRSPSQDAFLRSMNTLESVRLSASTIANSGEEYSLLARHNPGKCNCPEFEVFAYGEWRRASFGGPINLLKASRKYADKGSKVGEEISIKGSFSGELEAPNGVVYESFILTQFEDEVAPKGWLE